jgi:hypothetical protein
MRITTSGGTRRIGAFGFAHYEGPELGGAHAHGIRVMLR